MGFFPEGATVREIRYVLDKRREQDIANARRNSAESLCAAYAIPRASDRLFKSWDFHNKKGQRVASFYISLHKKGEWILHGALLVEPRNAQGKAICRDLYELSSEGPHSMPAFHELAHLINGRQITPLIAAYMHDDEIKRLGEPTTPCTLNEVIEYADLFGLIGNIQQGELAPKQRLHLIHEELMASVRSNRSARLVGYVAGHEENIWMRTGTDPNYKAETGILIINNGTVHYCLPTGVSASLHGGFVIYPLHGEHLVLVDADKQTGVASDIEVAYKK